LIRKSRAVYSIGYQGRSLDGLCMKLRDEGVLTLIDVRARAWSQRPQFRKGALTAALAASGITYLHMKSAGNPFRHDADTWADCKPMFRAHLNANPIVTRELAAAVDVTSAAVFCYEAERCACHRGVLLDRVKRRLGVRIVDL
jgi:uncharacterized protein (DUF488 family)